MHVGYSLNGVLSFVAEFFSSFEGIAADHSCKLDRVSINCHPATRRVQPNQFLNFASTDPSEKLAISPLPEQQAILP